MKPPIVIKHYPGLDAKLYFKITGGGFEGELDGLEESDMRELMQKVSLAIIESDFQRYKSWLD
jgi:hypothetical protein